VRRLRRGRRKGREERARKRSGEVKKLDGVFDGGAEL
jgi:hypothetical protein